jgi:hypothetical protein
MTRHAIGQRWSGILKSFSGFHMIPGCSIQKDSIAPGELYSNIWLGGALIFPNREPRNVNQTRRIGVHEDALVSTDVGVQQLEIDVYTL